MNNKEKKNDVKSGKEVLDIFFQDISSITGVNENLASALAGLYKIGKFTESNVINTIREIKEGTEIQLHLSEKGNQKKTEQHSDINQLAYGATESTLKILKPIKIKSLSISGIRGIKKSIDINLNEKSILLYGDNGSGKSSIADSLEWLYRNEVSHLSSNEIDLKEAMRNSCINKYDISRISVKYNNSLDIEKKLYFEKDSLESELTADRLEQYISDSKSENLFIRFRLLRDFVDKTKTDKVKFLSDIIGFSDVTKTRSILRKSVNSIKAEIKNQNFENQIEVQKKTLISKIGADVSRKEDFFKEIRKKITSLKEISTSISSFNDVDNILADIKKPVNTQQLSQLKFLDSVNMTLSIFENEIDLIDTEYKTYFDRFSRIASDINIKWQTLLFSFLKSGKDVIDEKYYTEDICPLCLQSKNIRELRIEIQKRFCEIEEESLKTKTEFDNAKESFENIITERLNRINLILKDPMVDVIDFKYIKEALLSIRSKFIAYQKTTISKEFISDDVLPESDSLILSKKDFNVKNNVEKSIETIKTDSIASTQIYADISAAKDAFMLIEESKMKENKLKKQKESLELIYNEFIRRQKESLEKFISSFSDLLNCFYQRMNPKESFQEIQINVIDEEDDLKGITMKCKYNGKWISPPQKYFSESHLNCLGLSFFLASVKAFNKTNKFVVFDDVISSFDTTHRKRFADLIFDEFGDYQVILLTHESEWFDQVRPIVKGKGWIINKIKWSESEGTYLDKKPVELKEFIENKIKSGSPEGVGNHMRQHLEHILKRICCDLKVKVPFRFNDDNEKRMAYELLNELKSTISKKSRQDLKLKKELCINDSIGLLNSSSHDGEFVPKIGDLKAVWTDIEKFENVFLCKDCKNLISMNNYDDDLKEIRCGCGKTKYKWEQ